MKKIPICCKGNRYLPYQELKIFQGNLKEMRREDAKKLRSSILKLGWVAPVFVWGDDEIIDGHGRLLVLGELIKEGYTIDALPIVDIEAKTKKDAAKILLAINSKYQHITDDGLYEFINNFDLSFDEIKEDIVLPDIDFGKFEQNFYDGEIIQKEYDENIKTENECPKCGYKW